jgi:4-hydroxy-2-oxoglutarate aldolase
MTTKQILARLHGILPPMVTPFNRNGDIDEGAFRANLARYTGIGLAGVVVAGTTGEAPYLTADERLRLTEIARSIVRPDELVITGTGLESTRETIRLSREAVARGADVLLVLTPAYFRSKMDKGALVAHYRALGETLPRPVLIYSIPQCTGLRAPEDTIAAVSRLPNIVGLKESSGDLAYMRSILRRVRPGFHVFSGSAKILLDALRAGAVGGILAQADFAPELCISVYQAFKDKRPKLARELHAQLVPLVDHINLAHGVAGVKAAMDLAGYQGGELRSPLQPASAAARRGIARVLEETRSRLAA